MTHDQDHSIAECRVQSADSPAGQAGSDSDPACRAEAPCEGGSDSPICNLKFEISNSPAPPIIRLRTLFLREHDKVWSGICPLCGAARMELGPWSGKFSRNLLCTVCYAEFSRSVFHSTLITTHCDPARAQEVYGL